ncbi:hypothetical protein X566_09875 [Afipia sp. P52-10]|jgi:uncharacterized membrane protein YedE/YeeE|uniref:hypothetical protein n=1 Tax=Afipia sp. P52-10 TaxID=1429916 RepID=UPI0003DF31BA|nr:hypothetical protein [Afipia sp. P52-10]ETR77930.1 hypothetical protein X566_09875 [Afipia sp. P52-10]
MALIGRLIVICVAFLAASLAAGCVIVLAVMYPEWSSLDLGPMDRDALSVVIGFGFIFVSGFALLPALVMALVTEAFSIRSILFYAIGGALFGLGVYLAFTQYDPSSMTFVGIERRELEVMTGAGIVAGLVYWLIAGRRAGAWRETSDAGRNT